MLQGGREVLGGGLGGDVRGDPQDDSTEEPELGPAGALERDARDHLAEDGDVRLGRGGLLAVLHLRRHLNRQVAVLHRHGSITVRAGRPQRGPEQPGRVGPEALEGLPLAREDGRAECGQDGGGQELVVRGAEGHVGVEEHREALAQVRAHPGGGVGVREEELRQDAFPVLLLEVAGGGQEVGVHHELGEALGHDGPGAVLIRAQ